MSPRAKPQRQVTYGEHIVRDSSTSPSVIARHDGKPPHGDISAYRTQYETHEKAEKRLLYHMARDTFPLMKKEFPALWANVSIFIATPLIIAVTMIYIDQFISRPATEIYGFGLSAIGTTAALSAICFRVVPPIGTDNTVFVMRYSGEKFLHACLLLIQVLIIAFARDAILEWEWVTRYDGLRRTVQAFAHTAGLFVAATAAWCWYWAFEELNKELWNNWRYRIDDINRITAPAMTHNEGQSSDRDTDKAVSSSSASTISMRLLKHTAVCSIIFGVSAWYSWRSCDGSWISRSGNLIVIEAILVEGWTLATTLQADAMRFWRDQEGHDALRIALWVGVVGELVQGYGDLLLGLLKTCPGK